MVAFIRVQDICHQEVVLFILHIVTMNLNIHLQLWILWDWFAFGMIASVREREMDVGLLSLHIHILEVVWEWLPCVAMFLVGLRGV